MFEKDQDYRKAKSECKVKITKAIKVWSGREEAIRDASFKYGAEFGYNKAKEEYEAKINALILNRDELLAENERLEERVGELEKCY